MTSNKTTLSWGIALALLGSYALASQLGYLRDLPPAAWMTIFAVSSAAFLAAWLVSGLRAWGWLFPSCICTALAGVIALATSGLPALERWIPTVMVASIALPFAGAFALNRARLWALFLALGLAFAALLPQLDSLLGSRLVGALNLAALGLAFLLASLISPRARWGLLPGGALCSLALMIAFTNFSNNGFAAALLFAGWALTFGLAWKLQKRGWALYPALLCAGLAIVLCLFFLHLGSLSAPILIALGLLLTLASLTRQPAAQP